MTRKKSSRTGSGKKGNAALVIAAVMGLAVVLVGFIIYLSTSGSGGGLLASTLDVETGFTEEGYPYRGSPDAPVTIVEYSNYLCPHCRDFALETLPKIHDKYIKTGKVRYVVHYFTFDNAIQPTEAAMCAADQGRFWEYDHLLFLDQRYYTRDDLLGYAEQVGLNVETFTECLDGGVHFEELQKSTMEGFAVGVNGTPTFFVNGEQVIGAYPFEYFEAMIDMMLKEQ